MGRNRNKYIFASNIRMERSHKFRNTMLLVLPLLVLLVFLANVIVSRNVKLEEETVTILNLPEALDCYSILHVSDLHGARYGEKQKAIENALDSARYSCVVMTGDMLGENQDVEPLLELVALMPKDKPKYFLPGDMDGDYIAREAHSSLSYYTEWAERLMAAGVTILDRPMCETRGEGTKQEGTIWFIPEDIYTLDLDVTEKVLLKQQQTLEAQVVLSADEAARLRALEYDLERLESIRETRKLIQPEDIQIVVTHTPLTEAYVAEMVSWSTKEEFFSIRYAGLVLAGHYNGGQWRVPFKGAIYVPELGWFPDDSKIQGLSYLGDLPQYISPGLGSDPHYQNMPGRLFNPPVLTKITLTNR